MFDNSERQGERTQEPAIFISNMDDPRVKKIISNIAEQKNKPPQKVTQLEIAAYCDENHILYVKEKKNESRIKTFINKLRSLDFS